ELGVLQLQAIDRVFVNVGGRLAINDGVDELALGIGSDESSLSRGLREFTRRVNGSYFTIAGAGKTDALGQGEVLDWTASVPRAQFLAAVGIEDVNNARGFLRHEKNLAAPNHLGRLKLDCDPLGLLA